MRLIDADKLLEGIAELKQSPWFNNKYGYVERKEAVETIEDLCIKKEPTIDAVEVVRCKDCKWYYQCHKKISIREYDEDIQCTYARFERLDYCSYGERRGEEWQED